MMSNSQRITTQLCRSPHLFSLFFFGNVFPVLLINFFFNSSKALSNQQQTIQHETTNTAAKYLLTHSLTKGQNTVCEFCVFKMLHCSKEDKNINGCHFKTPKS